MMLFFIGIIEMLILTVWTKVVTKSMVLASGAITLVNVLIWYYVIQTIVDDINNWEPVILYAFGCALGTVAGTWYYQWKEKREKTSSNGLQSDTNE